MKANIPNYELLNMGGTDWRFQESPEMDLATEHFYEIIEIHGGTPNFGRYLKKFIRGNPQHIDALSRYGDHQMRIGKPLEAYAFAHASVAVGKSYFPSGFDSRKDRLPGGFVQNRPFLRAMYGLMESQAELFDYQGAIATGKELIHFDYDDRMGARLVLPIYMLALSQNQAVVNFFAMERFEGCFDTAEYLHALALFRLGKQNEATQVLTECISRRPQVARFLLTPEAEPPKEDNRFGIIMGGELEGWISARQTSFLWYRSKGAPEFLSAIAKPAADSHWQRQKINPPKFKGE